MRKDYVRLGLRIPPHLNKALEEAAEKDYTTKNQKAIEIFKKFVDGLEKDSNKNNM